MGASENAARIRAGYESFNTGDIDGLIDLFAEDIVWQLPRHQQAGRRAHRPGRRAGGRWAPTAPRRAAPCRPTSSTSWPATTT